MQTLLGAAQFLLLIGLSYSLLLDLPNAEAVTKDTTLMSMRAETVALLLRISCL